MIIKKLALTTPPSRFFQGISTDYTDNITYAEYLLGILKKLNETVEQVNKNTEFIDKYSGRIETLEAEMASLQGEMETFKGEVQADINARFNAIVIELQSMVAVAIVQANAYTDATANTLREEIREISLGEITVYDPTTGVLNGLQDTLNNMYGATREEALTATEYDALELTATTYDGYEITAFNYDRYGKTILTA